MRKICLTLMLALMTCCQLVWAADLSKLAIIHTNDTHGFDQRAKGINGMATVAALKKNYETKGYTVFLLDAGDAIQDNKLVNLSEGKTAIEFMNASGYDAMCLGNHEFDYGQEVTLQRVKQAHFPILSTNIIVETTGKHFVQPSTVLTKNGYKVGVVGMTTPETITSTNPKNVAGLNFLSEQNLYKAVQQEVNKLRAEQCGVILGLGHLGSANGVANNKSDDVLKNVKGIDVFIDGHDHTVKNRYVKGILLAETGSHTNNIGVITYGANGWQEQLYKFGDFTEEDPKVKNLVAKRAAQVEKILGKKIGESTFKLDGNRYPGVRNQETNLGDFCADAFAWQGRQTKLAQGVIDGAIINGGSIRASLEPGKISLGTLETISPYANQLYVVQISGQELLEVLEACSYAAPKPLGAFPQVSGIEFTLNTKENYLPGKQYEHSTYFAPAQPGKRVTITTVGGKPFALGGNYNLVVSEFIVNGGDAYGALRNNPRRTFLGYKDIDAMVNYLKEELHGKIPSKYANVAGRIIIK